jgi:putative inorganic carbon (HCO3(-)) transporter
MLARARVEITAGPLLLLAGAAVCGLLAGIQPLLGVSAALAVAFTVVTLSNLTAGLVLFTVLSFLDVFSATSSGAASFMKVAGGLLFGSWCLARLLGHASTRGSVARIPAGAGLCVVALALWSGLSVTWAQSPRSAATATLTFLLDMLLIPIVMAAVRDREQLAWVLSAFVLGAIVSAAYALLDPSAAGAGHYGRLAGGIGDANEEAAVLVAAIPLAIALPAVSSRAWMRSLGWTGVIVCLLGVFATLSRGGLLALGVVLACAVLFGGRWRSRAALLLAGAVICTVSYYAVIAPLAARERVTMTTSNGRLDIWHVGWRMVQAHPLQGVGAGNFQDAAVHYVQAPGSITSARLIVDAPHVAHNVYLELLADLGIPGLLAFVGVAMFSLLAGLRAARAFERRGDAGLELAARCVVLALIGFLAADFFLSGEFSKQLWLTFALCSALLGLAQRGEGFQRQLAGEEGLVARYTG